MFGGNYHAEDNAQEQKGHLSDSLLSISPDISTSLNAPILTLPYRLAAGV